MKNLQMEALFHFFSGKNIEVKFLNNPDYNHLIEKCQNYYNKNSQFPSLTFLQANVKKLSEDIEQVDRLEDILYVLSKYKPELESPQEINELLLEDYKKDKIRDLTKALAQSQVDENWIKAERLAKEIGEISALTLGNDSFIVQDIKQDIENPSEVIYVPTGICFDKKRNLMDLPYISRTPTGSMLIYLAGTGVGKSMLALESMIENYLYNDDSIIYLSYELPKSQVLLRILANISGVPLEEIVKKEFSMEENELRVKASEWILKKKLDMRVALKHLAKDKQYLFEEFEDRKNKFKIIAALDFEEIERNKKQGIPNIDLPNDLEILAMMDSYKEEYDWIVVDLVSEIPWSNTRDSLETVISNFGKKFKARLLANNMQGILVSQPMDEQNVDNIIFPKYARALRTTSDMNIILLRTKEMRENNMIAICTEKNRGGIGAKAYIHEVNYETMSFERLDEYEEMSLYEVMNEVKKENRMISKEK